MPADICSKTKPVTCGDFPLSTTLTESDVLQACQTLFGTETNVCRGFLSYLQPNGAKSAFRKIAKENHPDYFAREALHVQKYQTELFQKIVNAYEVLNLFFKQRDAGWGFSSASYAANPGRRDYRHGGPAVRRKQNPGTGTVFRRPMPFHCLELGQFLYYQGMISYEALISALVWQRRQRPVIGDIALRWGWLTAPAINRVLGELNCRGRFGERAVQLGLLTLFQVNTLLFYQRSQQERLGRYFIEKKILSPGDLDRVVRELNEHNATVRCAAAGKGRMRRAQA